MPVLRRRRLTDHFEVDTEGSWAISYGDMITLLLTFFVLFYSTHHKLDRLNAMETALLVKLKNNADKSPSAIQHPGEDPMMVNDVMHRLDARAYKVGSKLIVEFPHVSFFDFGAVGLTKEGERQLAQFVKIYMPYAGNYILGVRAYTDNKKVRKKAGGLFHDNLELSALRAVATMRKLQVLGIPLNRMRLGGYGELRMTAAALSRAIASTPDYNMHGLALARKIVLVVEPEPREQL